MTYQITFVDSDNRINCPTMEIAVEIAREYASQDVSCVITELEAANVYC